MHGRTELGFLVGPVLACAVLSLASCSKRSDGAARENENVSTGDARVVRRTLAPYPTARWRLASMTDLHRVVVWSSHIVVLHAESSPAPSLRPPGWQPDAKFQRSSRDALQRALKIEQEVRANPAAFEEIAKRKSDDVVTAPRGGRLGGVRASQLPPEYLDALATLKPGEVSRAFQTTMGFHILRREAAPPREVLSASRILIRYREASPAFFSEAPASVRARGEALELSRKVVSLARSDPGSYGALRSKYSESIGLGEADTVGVWMTRDPGAEPAVGAAPSERGGVIVAGT